MRIEWSDHSRKDIREIIAYVGSSFGGRKALEVLSDIRDTANLLLAFPLMGKEFVVDSIIGITYHTVPSKFHQIVYFVEGENIKIVAIWNNRRDIRRLKRRLRRRSDAGGLQPSGCQKR